MQIKRSDIIKKFSWLKNKKCKYVVSASYDGMICASFLNHYLDWDLVGYYNLENLWISEEAKKHKQNIIWVDLNILPIHGRAIGGHIVAYNNEIPKGFDSSCNPNILVKLSSNDFKYKYPFSTIIFLMWLHNKEVLENDIAKFLLLHSDDVWLKYQKYNNNCNLWSNTLENYNWDKLFNKVDTKAFERKINQKYYPLLESHLFSNHSGKIKSKYFNVISRQLSINPDWDEDVILNLFKYFAEYLEWSPPQLPNITQRIDGFKNKIELSKIKNEGINHFIKKNKVFSYAITSNKTLSYTKFKSSDRNPIRK
tara:strand:- start:261 stop:1190 length:930 start_codon:yes stop_codon:yes gene_type:complete